MVMTVGTDSKQAVPVSYTFSFNGSPVDWGNEKLYKIKNLANSSEPINKKRKISDLNVTFIDMDGSIWESLGGGTTAFNKKFDCNTLIGGQLVEESTDVGDRFVLASTTGANEYTVFQGNVSEVFREKNKVTIQAQNIFRHLKELRWQQPIMGTAGTLSNLTGSTADSDLLEYDWLLNECGWGESEDRSSFRFNAVIGDVGGIDLTEYQGTGLYDTSSNGVQPMLSSTSGGTYQFTDTPFYIQYPIVEMKYRNSKVEWLSGANDDKARFIYPLKKIRLAGDPVAVLRHCLFGKMVTDYLNDSTDKGDTFDEAQRLTAYKFYDQTIFPEDDLVLPFIDNALETEESSFYVSNNNKFEIEPYGPKNLSEDIQEIGTSELVDSSTSNTIHDYYNRYELKFNYSFDNNTFLNIIGGTQDDWTILNDVPLYIESKWINNGNQAKITLDRIKARYKNTIPKVSFTTTLNKTGVDVGALVKVTDPDSSLATTIVQVTKYSKGFSSSKKIMFEGLNGETLFRQRGYAKWEGDDDLDASVSGTSVGGWGTMFNRSGTKPFSGNDGTIHNINESLYGSVFVHW